MPDHEDLDGVIRATYGFVPNSFQTLGRSPALLQAAARLGAVVMREASHTTEELRWLVAHVASRAAGCAYCSAHTSLNATDVGGASIEKIEAVWDFQSSPLFSASERAALELARAVVVSPRESVDEHVRAARERLGEDGLLEVVAVIALFGFFNRWNDTLATELEDQPLTFGRAHLTQSGWREDRHRHVTLGTTETETHGS